VHLAMVLLSGIVNNLRSMITGRYRITEEAR
jgi:thiosulfate reductase cytochrome b subunit